jgi:hypothetical protein
MADRKPTIGRIVIYRTDGRNGISYDLPAMVNCTKDTHPGDYPNGQRNPLPVPESDMHVHLTVFTPGGFGSTVETTEGTQNDSSAFVGATTFTPGSGSYVECNVPPCPEDVIHAIPSRSWRWPVIN